VPITTKVISSNPAHGEVYSIQYYVIKFVSDKSVVFSGFFHQYNWNIVKVALNTINQILEAKNLFHKFKNQSENSNPDITEIISGDLH
jgi:hypothetical protein